VRENTARTVQFCFPGLAILFVFFAPCDVAAQPYWLVEDLGALFGEYESSDGVVINEHGAVIGRLAVPGSGDLHGFYWSETEGTEIFVPKAGYHHNFVNDLNENGQVVGQHFSNLGIGQYSSEAFVWTKANGMRPLLEIGSASPNAINNNGHIVGSPPGFRWDPNQGFRTFPIPERAIVEDINDSSVTIGWLFDQPANTFLAFRIMPNGLVEDLPQIPGYFVPQPYDINNRGQIIGRSYPPRLDPPRHDCCGYFFDPQAGVRAIGSLVGDFEPLALNEFAHIVGFGEAPPGFGVANKGMVWSEEWGLIDLNKGHLASNGWYVEFVRDINNADQMVGTGFRDGVRHAVRLIPWPVPEPATGALALALAFAAALWSIRLRLR